MLGRWYVDLALRRRGTCTSCGLTRGLVTPPGPAATVCADCADLPVQHAYGDCGIEDKLYERGRCDRCALARRTAGLLAAGQGHVPPFLEPVHAPRSPPRPVRAAR